MRNIYLGAAIAWTIFLTVLCLVSMEKLGPVNAWQLPYKDKVGHFVFYFVFTILWYAYFYSRKKTNLVKLRYIALIAAFIYGSLVELSQLLFTNGRNADILDIAFNTMGSAAAVLLLWLLQKSKN